MVLDHRFQILKDLRSVLSVATYPVQYAVNFPVTAGAWMGESFSTRETLLSEVTRLKTQQLLLNVRLQKLAALETENMRLRKLLDSAHRSTEKVLIAELMAVDVAPFSRQITLNKGSRHSLYDGQPLLDADGIIGQITRVTPLSSTAMLITDPNHAIPVAINRNGLRAIAFGTGDMSRLDLPHFPNNADVKVGDLLVSTGLGGHFPRGHPVATVSAVELDPGQPFARVIAEPTAQLQRGREVLLVWPQDQSSTQQESSP